MASLNTEYLAGLIRTELIRHDTGNRAVTVDAGNELPEGWVRLDFGDDVTIIGPACQVLETIHGFTPDGTDSVWETLGATFRSYDTLDQRDDPPHAWDEEQELTGIDLPGGLGLIAFHTNGCLEWGFGSSDPERSAEEYSKRYDTPQEAIGAAALVGSNEEEGIQPSPEFLEFQIARIENSQDDDPPPEYVRIVAESLNHIYHDNREYYAERAKAQGWTFEEAAALAIVAVVLQQMKAAMDSDDIQSN